MTHHTEQCCKECSGWEPALHECSCQCHYATDESAVDWEKTARQIFANELIEQRFTDKFMDFICSLLTSKDAQHKAEVETARKEEREQVIQEIDNSRDPDSCECDNCHRWRKFSHKTLLRIAKRGLTNKES